LAAWQRQDAAAANPAGSRAESATSLVVDGHTATPFMEQLQSLPSLVIVDVIGDVTDKSVAKL